MMIGIDTNVLLRAMLDDDPGQSALAKRLLSGLTPERPGYVGVPVVLELFWVLRTRMRLPRREIVATLFELFGIDTLIFEESEILIRSLRYFEMAGTDFSDAVIALRHSHQGCKNTITFDANAARDIPGMELLK